MIRTDSGVRARRAGLVAADEDTVRDIVHAFNARGWPRCTPSGREAVLA
jgi:hypothetical protein